MLEVHHTRRRVCAQPNNKKVGGTKKKNKKRRDDMQSNHSSAAATSTGCVRDEVVTKINIWVFLRCGKEIDFNPWWASSSPRGTTR
jgi:hypothetical protein